MSPKVPSTFLRAITNDNEASTAYTTFLNPGVALLQFLNSLNGEIIISANPKKKRLLDIMHALGFNLRYNSYPTQNQHIYELLINNNEKYFVEYLKELDKKILNLSLKNESYRSSLIDREKLHNQNLYNEEIRTDLFWLGTSFGGILLMSIPFIHVAGYVNPFISIGTYLLVKFYTYGILLAPLVCSIIGALTLGLGFHYIGSLYVQDKPLPDLEENPALELNTAINLKNHLRQLLQARNECLEIENTTATVAILPNSSQQSEAESQKASTFAFNAHGIFTSNKPHALEYEDKDSANINLSI